MKCRKSDAENGKIFSSLVAFCVNLKLRAGSDGEIICKVFIFSFLHGTAISQFKDQHGKSNVE